METTQTMTYEQADRIQLLLELVTIQLHDLLAAQLALHVHFAENDESLSLIRKAVETKLAERNKLVSGTLKQLNAMGVAERTDQKRNRDEQLSKMEQEILLELSKPPVGFKPK